VSRLALREVPRKGRFLLIFSAETTLMMGGGLWWQETDPIGSPALGYLVNRSALYGVTMLPPAADLPAEAFGVLLSPGPLAKPARDRLERRRKDPFCPFLMTACPRPYPICSVFEGGKAIAICPHRLLEGQEIFRSLAQWLPGYRPTLLRHLHPAEGSGGLGWVLFDQHHPDRWIGVNAVTPVPADEAALAWATHDLFRHGMLRDEGYPLSFVWPASTADGGRLITRQAEWARTWQRPVYTFMPTPLFERLRALVDLRGVSLSPLALAPVSLEREVSALRLRVPVPPAPKPAPAERGGIWKALLQHWSEWISLQVLGRVVDATSPDQSGD